MTKLTTGRLEKLQDNLLQFQDAYSDPADKENYDIFVDALHVIDEFKAAKEKLLAYEQADKTTDLKTLVISEIIDFFAVSESLGWPKTADEAQYCLITRIENVLGLAAPVLPKQPDGTLTYEGTIPASAQPVSEPYKLPSGWKLVPIEPTAAMFHAFNDCDYGRKSMRERYIQMIEAAPAQESE